jgi:hypothetical protein
MSDTPVSSSDAVTLRDNDRKLFAQYVTGERQKWRDRMRELVIETAGVVLREPLPPNKIRKLHVIRAELRVRLNPEKEDKLDQKIIECIDQIIEYKDNYEERLKRLFIFEEEVSWLLKEDWERVKHDMSPFWQCLRGKRKVDRNSKTISKENDLLNKFKDFCTVLIFIALLGIFTFAVTWSYEFAQAQFENDKECCENECKEKVYGKSCKKVNQEACLKLDSSETDKSAIAPQNQPYQITVSPLIIYESVSDQNEVLDKVKELKTDLSNEMSNTLKKSMNK